MTVLEKMRTLLKNTFLGEAWRKYRFAKEQLRHWRMNRFKQSVVKDYARENGLAVFVETGTYRGDMVFAVKNIFRKIYSVELGEELYERARQRFAGFRHITIMKGDSKEVLPKILEEITEPGLFWLDAHYSSGVTARGDKDTPIEHELKAIYGHPIKNHIILIDDAGDFSGENDYPTLEKVRREARENGYGFACADGIIRIRR